MDVDQYILDKYEAAKRELKTMYDPKGKETIFRSKTKWIGQGEKLIKYFFNLEKTNYAKKTLL